MTKISIVLVEDHDLTRVGLRTALEQESNMKIVGEAANGKKGLEILKQTQPDIAIIDIGLPDMDGIELCRNFRTILGFNDKPIIALTGFLTKFDNPTGTTNSHKLVSLQLSFVTSTA